MQHHSVTVTSKPFNTLGAAAEVVVGYDRLHLMQHTDRLKGMDGLGTVC